MKRTVVEIDPGKKIIQPSSWGKKELADAHLDVLKFCEFACTYCSSNSGMHLKMLKQTINNAVRDVTGCEFNPHDAAHIVIALRCIEGALESELAACQKRKGEGMTLVFSQLTDGFSPHLLRNGTTRRVLELVLERTSYRIRILTKNAVVGRPEWIRFFLDHADRFVVGLSIGSLDDAWAKSLERLTPPPTRRIKALHALQDAGVATFGMLCPMFPDVLKGDHVERLVDAVRPERCERVWAEPFNDRQNWMHVRDCYAPDSPMWAWLTDVYESGNVAPWSDYAAELYERVHDRAIANGWREKLRYLLYETDVVATDATRFRGLDGVLLQSKPDENGLSRNPAFAAI